LTAESITFFASTRDKQYFFLKVFIVIILLDFVKLSFAKSFISWSSIDSFKKNSFFFFDYLRLGINIKIAIMINFIIHGINIHIFKFIIYFFILLIYNF